MSSSPGTPIVRRAHTSTDSRGPHPSLWRTFQVRIALRDSHPPFRSAHRMADQASPFASLGEAELRELSPGGVVRSFPKGAVLMNEGDGTDALYVLLLGRVKAFVSDAEGREFV